MRDFIRWGQVIGLRDTIVIIIEMNETNIELKKTIID
jgi:hypothetical protein